MSAGFVVHADVVGKFATGDDVRRTMLKLGSAIETEAKHLCPVDTGRLRASIVTTEVPDPDGVTVTVGTDVEYAPYVEFGTSRMAAQPFLTPATYAVVNNLKSRV